MVSNGYQWLPMVANGARLVPMVVVWGIEDGESSN